MSLQRLAEAYQHFGFVQVLQDPFKFENPDGEIYFHDATPNRMLDLEFVIEDIAVWDRCFAEQMRAYLKQTPDDVA